MILNDYRYGPLLAAAFGGYASYLGKSGSRIARLAGCAAVASTAIFLYTLASLASWRDCSLGVRLIRMINFGEEWMKTLIHRIVNDWIDENG